MDVVHPRCAGIDCSTKDAKVCVRIAGQGRKRASSTVTTWGATTSQILALRQHLLAEKVTCVVIESTSDYWKPFYYLLDDELDMMLVNASRVRNVPGRKTDVSDAAWLADLGAHGLVTASLVPPPPIRALRDLTRARTHITRERSREVMRLEKLLEDAGIKLSSVATDITGVSGRAMLEALIAGQTDPAVIADLAKRTLRRKIADLTEALVGRFNEHHAFMARLFLDRIDAHTADISRLDARIEEAMAPFRLARELLMSIPGILHQDRRCIHRRNRRRHERVPQRGPSGVLGGSLTGLPRVRWPDQVDKDTPRQPVSQRRTGCVGDVGGTVEEHLLLRQVPADQIAARPDARTRRRRTRPGHHRVEHAHQRRVLP